MIDGRTGGAEGPIKAATMLQDAKAQVGARAHGAKAADIPTGNAPAEAQGPSGASDMETTNGRAAASAAARDLAARTGNDPAAHPRTANGRTNDPAAVMEIANAPIEVGVEMNAGADMAVTTDANALEGEGADTNGAAAQANPAKAENAGTSAHVS